MNAYHTLPIDETFEQLNSSRLGLTEQEAERRRARHGKNVLPEGKKETLLSIFIDQFKNPIIYVLMIAAIVSFLIKEFTDAWFIMAVLLINAFIGLYQEYTAGQKADALKHAVKTYAFVLRDGNKKEILSEDVTMSDIVLLESGSKVPADMRLVESNQLFVNESLLTGESVDVQKNAHFISDEPDLPVADRKNMLYAGSFITRGRAVGVVSAIGEHTQVGKIAKLLATATKTKAPLIKRMEVFSVNIAKAIGMVILFLTFLGLYQDIGLKEVFFLSVALAVSAIPEGLPVAITVALSVASSAMSKRHVIVRKLASIEGLGSCTFIASDKTGTLTQNRLTVEHFLTFHSDNLPEEKMDDRVYQAAILCNEASVVREGDDYAYLGDQVDVALAKYALIHEDRMLDFKYGSTLVDEIPYESENGYSATAYDTPEGRFHFIKGSPETIVGMCHLNEQQKLLISEQVDEWASKGFRNIALAYKRDEGSQIELEGFYYLGIAAIIDPLREGVFEAIEAAQSAGIEVAMVTGDHPHTAYYIAEALGIAVDKEEVIEGREIKAWIDAGADPYEIEDKRVFARVSPEQKQMIVKAFQKLGHFVAVTGDGVNDAPALKYANIGISMGRSGTDVAREASDLVLTDDSFASIVNGIEVGRVAYDNIRKVIHLLISTGFAEVVLIVLSMIFFLPVALFPIQLLWLNLVTNGIQHISLILEKAESDVLTRKPRSPKEPIFNAKMVRRVFVGGVYMGISTFVLFSTLLSMGYSEESARNLVLLMMVLFENVHVFNSRSELYSIFSMNHLRNRFLIVSVIIAQSIHIISMHIPFMQKLLHIEPISLQMWFTLSGLALLLVVIMEIEKLLYHRRN